MVSLEGHLHSDDLCASSLITRIHESSVSSLITHITSTVFLQASQPRTKDTDKRLLQSKKAELQADAKWQEHLAGCHVSVLGG